MNKKASFFGRLIIIAIIILFMIIVLDILNDRQFRKYLPQEEIEEQIKVGPICGNNKCEVNNEIDEFLSCPQDCGIICGDEECVTSPYDERINCPQDCQITTNPNINIPQKNVLSSGITILSNIHGNKYEVCTLGAIISGYGLTASHCLYSPDIIRGSDYIKIGTVYKTTSPEFDAALIKLNNIDFDISSQDNIGNTVNSFGDYEEGLKVYKIGATTGLTYGTIGKKKNMYKLGLIPLFKEQEGYYINEPSFCEPGDSGSAIVTVESPHRIVGIVSKKQNIQLFDIGGKCFSVMPQDIKRELQL